MIQTKNLELLVYGDIEKVDISISKYYEYDNLAICLTCSDTEEPFGALTVNLKPLNSYLAAIDTNNIPDAENFIQKYSLGVPLGISIPSGFCEYPIYDFTELVNQLDKEKEDNEKDKKIQSDTKDDIYKKEVTFTFTTSKDWEPATPGCWIDCPFKVCTKLGQICFAQTNDLCPFTKNVYITKISDIPLF